MIGDPSFQGTPFALLAHGSQVVWCFASVVYEKQLAVADRMSALEKRLDSLERENASLRQQVGALHSMESENAWLRDALAAVRTPPREREGSLDDGEELPDVEFDHRP
jgi:cell division protein FtsB